MENHVKKLYHRLPMLLVGLVVWSSLFVSCKDDYPYDDSQPDWLGESIYEYLAADGHYKNFVKIIDDLNYSEVLRKTGSKTIFVADDAAFERFYRNNKWGVTNYKDLTESQKKLILNFSVINNAYLIETLSNYYDNGLKEGSAIRRTTAVSLLDSVPYVLDAKLPKTTYWNYYQNDRKSGIYLLQDATNWPMVHFLQKSLDYNGISDADFKIMTGITRERNDAHIFSHKVIKRDIACKNGYINVLDDVLIPPTNMAGYMRTVPQLSLFSSILDWFSAPYYDRATTSDYKRYLSDKGISFNDSIFELCYFSSNGGKTVYPDNSSINNSLFLLFDPGYNSYKSPTGSLQSDMAAIFAPTNDALQEYLESAEGRAIKDRYQTWDNMLPKMTDDKVSKAQKMKILARLVNRHFRESLVNSIPSLFYKMVDNTSSSLQKPGKSIKDDIIESLNYVGLNGLVYVTKKVYPPDDFVSVYGPVFFSDKSTVIFNSIDLYKYNLYLNSMVNKYAFIAPTDSALTSYIDPVTYGTASPTVLKFWYDASVQKVKASIFGYDKVNKKVTDSITVNDNAAFIKSRLVNILDQSIIVKDVVNKDGNYANGYYLTKDGNVIKANNIENIGQATSSPSSYFQGGGDLASTPAREVHVNNGGIYHQENGTTFMVNKLIQTPLKSVYSVLSDSANYPEFQEFFKFLSEFPKDRVFINKANYWGVDKFNIKFFNTFRYTVYVPDNQAMLNAYSQGLIKTWDAINKMPVNTPTEVSAKNAEIDKLERFARYHFQDNSVFIYPNQSFEGLYQTATIKKDDGDSQFHTAANKFFRIKVENASDLGKNTLKLICDKPGSEYSVKVNVSDDKYYNIMTRDFIFSKDPSKIASLTSTDYLSSEITTSSTAVIHRISQVLSFE